MSDPTVQPPIWYAYDPATGAYAGCGPADPSPLDQGAWLLPGCTTPTAPPIFGAGQIPVFVAGAWSLIPDHRGEVWYGPAGAVTIDRIGDPVAFDPRLSRTAPPPRTITPTVTGNQWAFALGDLGLAAAWRAGVARSKDKDQIRWGLVARDTPLLATDPLLIRIAVNAGTDGNGAALIDVPTVFAKAQTEGA